MLRIQTYRLDSHLQKDEGKGKWINTYFQVTRC